ncbi:MAG: hypothetical protein QOG76_7021, partial [Pseudonocardiales bacterium]|nr:hypothetical protein [Pseudonocardiales bacterium]
TFSAIVHPVFHTRPPWESSRPDYPAQAQPHPAQVVHSQDDYLPVFVLLWSFIG